MSTNTYVALDKVTVSGTSTTYIDFTSIPQTYTDLVIVTNAASSLTPTVFGCTLKMNGDTGSNYSSTYLYGTGSATGTGRSTSYGGYGFESYTSTLGVTETHIQNYSNTTTYKTWISRSSDAGTSGLVGAWVGLWRSTAAITSVRMFAADIGAKYFLAGSTFTIYGIAAASVGAKATGGTIYSDSSYFYHVFSGNGTFTPSQSISADVLVVAGGGGGGHWTGGGGGSGGLLGFTSQSLTATGYTVSVGAGGAGGTSGTAKGTNGVNSQFGALTASVGGGAGGGYNGSYASPNTGGSGGGGTSTTMSGAAGTSGQGNSGGAGIGAPNYNGGGGGGIGSTGSAAGAAGGTGGSGVNTYSSWLSVTGFGVSGYLAGGGGGGANNSTAGTGTNGGGDGSRVGNIAGGNGVAYTGSGGGGGGWDPTNSGGNGGAGGSGLVIVRYAK